MKIAFISDIHANYLGLSTVLEDIGTVDQIYCLGDITGYYPFPNEVIDQMKANNIISVLGNHDQYLLDGFAPENANSMVKQSVEMTKKIISKENLQYLKSLPDKLNVTIAEQKVIMCHGSPWNILEERIYPDFKDFEKFELLDQDIIVLGHTHYPMIKVVGKKKIVNPGSCGQPRDYNLLSYAIWDTMKVKYKIIRLEWDFEFFKTKAMGKGCEIESFYVFNRKKV